MTSPLPSRTEELNPFSSPRTESRIASPRDDWPLWVRIGLWKIPTRRIAWGYLAASLLLLFGTAVVGFWPGLIFLLAVYWYWEAIGWVDENSRW